MSSVGKSHPRAGGRLPAYPHLIRPPRHRLASCDANDFIIHPTHPPPRCLHAPGGRVSSSIFDVGLIYVIHALPPTGICWTAHASQSRPGTWPKAERSGGTPSFLLFYVPREVNAQFTNEVSRNHPSVVGQFLFVLERGQVVRVFGELVSLAVHKCFPVPPPHKLSMPFPVLNEDSVRVTQDFLVLLPRFLDPFIA